ncbi:MAG: hypothetical protein MI747_24645, partial [Desulfobacterales bacterium]|nr:hypothetical protein [Desulfobacterales bacterium]
MKRNLSSLIAFFSCLMWIPITAVAAPVVDGKISQGEYTGGYEMSFGNAGSTVASGGKMWYTKDVQNNNNLYMAFSLPLSLADNSYGSNSIGWKQDQTFQNLLENTQATFIYQTADGSVDTFTLDYLFPTGHGGGYDSGLETPPNGIKVATSMEYNLGLPGALGKYAGNPGNSPGVNPGNHGGNLYDDDNNNGIPNGYEGSEEPDWIFEMIYEFSLSGDLLAQNWDPATTVQISLSQTSPSKIDISGTLQGFTGSPISPVPLPSPLLL